MANKKDNKALWIIGAILLFVFIQSGKKQMMLGPMNVNTTPLWIIGGIILLFFFMMFKN